MRPASEDRVVRHAPGVLITTKTRTKAKANTIEFVACGFDSCVAHPKQSRSAAVRH